MSSIQTLISRAEKELLNLEKLEKKKPQKEITDPNDLKIIQVVKKVAHELGFILSSALWKAEKRSPINIANAP